MNGPPAARNRLPLSTPNRRQSVVHAGLRFVTLPGHSSPGVQPIVGALLALAGTGNGRELALKMPSYLLLLAQTETGYRNLVKLVSKAHLQAEPGVPPETDLVRRLLRCRRSRDHAARLSCP